MRMGPHLVSTAPPSGVRSPDVGTGGTGPRAPGAKRPQRTGVTRNMKESASHGTD